MDYCFLAIAIASEVTATSALKASDSFTKILPTGVVLLGYICSFYFFSLCLNKISLGIAYAMWSGLGIVFVTIVAAVLYKQKPDLPALLGMALIVAGVVVLNLWSKTSAR